jgi:hypothetical protein
MKSFKKFVSERGRDALPVLDRVMIVTSGDRFELYEGRKWIPGRFERNIGIDQPTHGVDVGQQHAHVYGRKGEQIVVVNFDGTASHGTRGRIPDEDADALRNRGFAIRDDNVVEWIVMPDQPQLLLE